MSSPSATPDRYPYQSEPIWSRSEKALARKAFRSEKAFGQGIECGHGGSEHEQPICDARPLSLPKRTDLVEVRKSPRPQSLRRCSEAGASRADAGNKKDGQPDQQTG